MVASKLVIANNHFSPSARIIVGEMRKFAFVDSFWNQVFLVVLFLFDQSAYQYVFQKKVTIQYSLRYSNSFSCYEIFNENFIVCETSLICLLRSEVFFIILDLPSLSLETGWFCLLCAI